MNLFLEVYVSQYHQKHLFSVSRSYFDSKSCYNNCYPQTHSSKFGAVNDMMSFNSHVMCCIQFLYVFHLYFNFD